MRQKKTNRTLDPSSVQAFTPTEPHPEVEPFDPPADPPAEAKPPAKKRTSRRTKAASFTQVPMPEKKRKAATNLPVNVRFPPELRARLDEEHRAINAESGQVLTMSEIIRGAVLHFINDLDDARENDDREKYEALWADNMGVSFDD